jgi:ATP-binding protein involved in chromosome partitioning
MLLSLSRFMSEVTKSSVEVALQGATVQFSGVDPKFAHIVVEPAVGDVTARVQVTFGFPVSDIAASLAEFLSDAICSATGAAAVSVEVDWKVRPHAVQGTLKPLPGVKNIIAVASGKGGVGKSTTAVNLALALSRQGASVGMLDADIYGPSQPKMLGLDGQQPISKDGKSFEPLEGHGLQANSVGFLIDEQTPVVWRGPMVTQALNQLAFTTNWRDLDYLIVDLPPGTGDIQLTLTQQVPLAGVVIITTPQDIALLDARRGLKMFEKVGVRILGIVENMSVHICTACGHEEALFGAGGGDLLSDESSVPLLGKLPLDAQIQRQADSGAPTVVSDPQGPVAEKYLAIARATAAQLAAAPRDHKGAFPKIVVE